VLPKGSIGLLHILNVLAKAQRLHCLAADGMTKPVPPLAILHDKRTRLGHSKILIVAAKAFEEDARLHTELQPDGETKKGGHEAPSGALMTTLACSFLKTISELIGMKLRRSRYVVGSI
jgi:hypothetical protein